MKKNNIIFLLISALLLIACGGGHSTKGSDVSPISLSQVNHLKRVTGIAGYDLVDSESDQVYDFDLGDIQTTDVAGRFIINYSTGITDLNVESDDSAFIVTPKLIKSIGIPDTNGLMPPVPEVNIKILHGLNSSGLGRANILSGDRYATITFTGTANGDRFTTSYTMKVHAKRMYITRRIVREVFYSNGTTLTNTDENAFQSTMGSHFFKESHYGTEMCYDSAYTWTNLRMISIGGRICGSMVTSANGSYIDTTLSKYNPYNPNDSIVQYFTYLAVDSSSQDCYLELNTGDNTYKLSLSHIKGVYANSLDYIVLHPVPSGSTISKDNEIIPVNSIADHALSSNCPVFLDNDVISL